MVDLTKGPDIDELQVYLFKAINEFAKLDREYAALGMRWNAARKSRDELQDRVSFQLLLLDVKKGSDDAV